MIRFKKEILNKIVLIICSSLFIGCNGQPKKNENPNNVSKTELTPSQITNKWGFVDSKNNVIIEPNFDEVRPFSDGLAAVKIKHWWSFIDKKGSFVIEPKFGSVYDFSEGLCAVNTTDFTFLNGGWANQVIDKTGKIIFTGNFNGFEGYSNGVATYREMTRSSDRIFIDRQGNILESR